ncbi:MAG: N-acyl homoserine lactonase family protein [Thaumarchaeota archaeon]|nr:N-acyl homoserine lactonase family protein [Nitrososphaerota archaeon]
MVKAHLLVDGIFEVDRRIFLPESPASLYDGVAKSLLIIDGKEKILIDTGIGGVPEGSQFDALRKMMKITRNSSQGTKHQLAELGIRPGEITSVVNTHLHNAHCGCNNLFPDAQFYISREEFRAIDELMGDDPNQTAYIDENFGRLKNVNRVKGRYNLTESVTIIPTPGHTMGHQSVVVKLKNYNLIYSGDVSPLKENLVTRTPMTGYDRKMIREQMKKLLKVENAKWIFSHDNSQLSLRQAYVAAR